MIIEHTHKLQTHCICETARFKTIKINFFFVYLLQFSTFLVYPSWSNLIRCVDCNWLRQMTWTASNDNVCLSPISAIWFQILEKSKQSEQFMPVRNARIVKGAAHSSEQLGEPVQRNARNQQPKNRLVLLILQFWISKIDSLIRKLIYHFLVPQLYYST